MATALLLVEKFSDVNNLLYNAGIINDNGDFVDCGTADPVKPAKKKRKKMYTKTESGLLAKHYYFLCGYFLALQKRRVSRSEWLLGIFCVAKTMDETL